MSKYDGHTPGPWRVGPFGAVKASARRVLYATIHGDPGLDPAEVAQATTRLAADAPELLRLGEALAKAVEDCKHVSRRSAGCDILCDALADWRELVNGEKP